LIEKPHEAGVGFCAVPPPLSILETSLYVSELGRAIAFYRDVLGLRLMVEFENHRGAAFQVGSGFSVLLLFRAEETRKGGTFPPHGATGAGHAAFRIEAGVLAEWRERLAVHNVAIEKELSFGGQPPSIYFRDPDGNSLELAVSAIWPFE
jgi:catechol 2,3-dioxygenase-like lactoylglutathione lyase family enzyme